MEKLQYDLFISEPDHRAGSHHLLTVKTVILRKGAK
jgi:hypothetical protein